MVAAVPVLVVLALLVPFIDVDPIAGVTASNSPFTDEGWNVMNARNWALFGTPQTDQWALYVLTLPFTVIDAIVFRLLGVGIVQARLVDIACVAATSGLLGIGLRRPFGPAAALVAGIGFGTSTLTLFYGRMAYLEPMAGLFLAAGTLSILAVDGPRPGRWGVIGGAALALAIGTKATVIPGVAGVLAISALGATRHRGTARWFAAAGLTVLAAAAAWGVLVWLRNRDAVTNILTRIYPPSVAPTLGGWIQRALAYPLSNDRALRHTAPLLIAAVGGTVASARGVRSLSTGARLLIGASLGGFVLGLAGIVLGVGVANRYVAFLIPWLAILSAPLAAAIVRWASTSRGGGGGTRRIAEWAVVAGLAGLLAVQGVVSQASWMRDGRRELVVGQAEAARILPPGSAVAGGYAPLLAMTSSATTIVPCCGSHPINAGDLYATAGIRFWADVSPPSWAPEHESAWAARQPFACLSWTWIRRPLCLDRLP